MKVANHLDNPMQKLQFLCSNHRQWLASNPRAAVNAWQDAYHRGVDLAEDEDYIEATKHAGAAFETAEIVLSHPWNKGPVRIRRFTESAALLVQLFYELKEPRLAASVLGSTIGRLERLLISHSNERKEVLAGCCRMQQVADEMATPEQPHAATDYLLAAGTLQVLH